MWLFCHLLANVNINRSWWFTACFLVYLIKKLGNRSCLDWIRDIRLIQFGEWIDTIDIYDWHSARRGNQSVIHKWHMNSCYSHYHYCMTEWIHGICLLILWHRIIVIMLAILWCSLNSKELKYMCNAWVFLMILMMTDCTTDYWNKIDMDFLLKYHFFTTMCYEIWT